MGNNGIGLQGVAGGGFHPNPNPTGTFSWLDLGATWNFATQNNSVTGSTGDIDDVMVEGGSGSGSGMSPFDMDMSLLTDYSLLEGDNPNLIF